MWNVDYYANAFDGDVPMWNIAVRTEECRQDVTRSFLWGFRVLLVAAHHSDRAPLILYCRSAGHSLQSVAVRRGEGMPSSLSTEHYTKLHYLRVQSFRALVIVMCIVHVLMCARTGQEDRRVPRHEDEAAGRRARTLREGVAKGGLHCGRRGASGCRTASFMASNIVAVPLYST